MARDPGEPCPQVAGDEHADVVVVGGGYTGMWTAYFLTELSPGIRVVLAERDVCGGGPSGRNGGFVTGWWDELPDLVEMYGSEPALAACAALGESVRAIGEWSDRHEVDAWYTRGGYLWVSSSPDQEGSWSSAVAAAERLGVGAELVALSPAEVKERCISPVFGGGAFMRDGATVQPARLARGLRRVLLERGVLIHENTRVRRLAAGSPVRAVTDGGSITADRAILGINAWATGWPGFRRSLVTWGSHIVLTAPAPERLRELGWTGGECITDSRTAIHYFRTTPDGRVAFGGGGGRSPWWGRVHPRLDWDGPSIARAQAGLRRLLPGLADVPVVEAWGGPIDVSPTHLPFFGTAPPGNVHYGFGYSGNGVAPAHLGGRILAALALDLDDEVTRLPMVGRRPRSFPPEPIRSIGARVIREAVVRRDRAQDEGRRVPPVVDWVARLPRKLGYRLGAE